MARDRARPSDPVLGSQRAAARTTLIGNERLRTPRGPKMRRFVPFDDGLGLGCTPAPSYIRCMYTSITTHTTLLSRLVDGEDSEAWREFDDRYGELIRSFARHRGMQAADCEDVAQEVLLSLSKAMPGFQYDPAKGKFRSYLKTVTLRTIFKKTCQKHGTVALGDIEEATRVADADAAIDEVWDTEWRQYHLRQAMRVIRAEFGEADRRAFQRYAVEGHDARETATSLAMTVDRVYQAKSRITKRLTQIIALQVQDEG
jgi:RNA polymerase sigma-70 factor (ECF subfamily)